MSGKALLIILDGWGIGAGDDSDAIARAKTPFCDESLRMAPHARLLTHGGYVGLPAGQMGNSELGHLNIGAGRVVHQDLVRIDRAIADGSLAANPALRSILDHARQRGRLHLMGLLSDGGVHSMRTHAEALCRIAGSAGVKEVLVHAFTDGRDTDPRSGKACMELFLKNVQGTGARVTSIVGRYYAMDRDKRWERVQCLSQCHVVWSYTTSVDWDSYSFYRGRGVWVAEVTVNTEDSEIVAVTEDFILPFTAGSSGISQPMSVFTATKEVFTWTGLLLN